MESISGPRPVTETVTTPRIAAPAGTVASSPQAVQPTEHTSKTRNDGNKPTQDDAQLRKALETLEKRLPVNVSVDIVFDESIKREVVRGTSKITGETLMEFPTKQMRNLIRGLREDLGLTVDQKV